MNIQILHSWLLEYLDTNATPAKIGEYLSLCGPSIERIEKCGNDWVYDIEVTTNRVDMMSVYGIAREAAVILPQFGVKASLKPLNPVKPSTPKESLPFILKPNEKLVTRTMAVVLNNIQNWKTPIWMKTRLEASGIRSLNAVVDITNYVMTEVGHPCHAFDYDLIKSHTIMIRESKKGEKIVGLDNKTYALPVGSIVFDDSTGAIIDLPGIMGTKNTVVNDNTKQVLFFIDNNDPIRIRKTSMTTGIRTVAATLNEKGVDPELAEIALLRGVELYKQVCQAEVASKVYDVYHKAYKPKSVQVTKTFIDERLGIEVTKARIETILKDLGFGAKWNKELLTVTVPSFRAQDVTIPEDIVEEVARIYGYHNLPSELMTGKIPDPLPDAPFDFELKTKRILQMFGGVEVYTISLVSAKDVDPKVALKTRNPLGSDTEYLRTSLAPSLIHAAKENSGEKESFHLFEMANVYLPRKRDLPEEKIILAGIFANTSFRNAKGVVEGLLRELHIEYSFEVENAEYFVPNTRLSIKHAKKEIGRFGQLENGGNLYYQFEVEELRKAHKPMPKYKSISKYPAQVEDITLGISERMKVGDVITAIVDTDKLIADVDLKDVFENAYTFRVSYQNPQKTLTDKEVEEVRMRVLENLKRKFGIRVK
jgi:phenylalanyl-tRNA synthetase beta chain